MEYLGAMWDHRRGEYAEHCLKTPLLNGVMHYLTSSWAYLHEFTNNLENIDGEEAQDAAALEEVVGSLKKNPEEVRKILEKTERRRWFQVC